MAETRCRRTDHKEKCESVLLLNQDLTPKSCHACDSHCEYMTAAVMEAVQDESDNLASRSSIDCSPPSRGQSFAPPANLSLKILNIAGLQLQRTNSTSAIWHHPRMHCAAPSQQRRLPTVASGQWPQQQPSRIRPPY